MAVDAFSRSGAASGRNTAITTAMTTSAVTQPTLLSNPCAAGTITNWPTPPTAPATPSAQLRRSGGVSRLIAPYTTPNEVPESPMPISPPADNVKPSGVPACAISTSPSA